MFGKDFQDKKEKGSVQVLSFWYDSDSDSIMITMKYALSDWQAKLANVFNLNL